MEFIDLKAQQSKIREKIDKRIKSVLNHGKYIMGPEVFELEEKLREYVGMKYCISCASGTDALLIPLMASDIGLEIQLLQLHLHTLQQLKLYHYLEQNLFSLIYMKVLIILILIILKMPN